MNLRKNHIVFKLKALKYWLLAFSKKVKDIIKIKYNLIVFSLFISIINQLFSIFFKGLIIFLADGLMVGLTINNIILIA